LRGLEFWRDSMMVEAWVIEYQSSGLSLHIW